MSEKKSKISNQIAPLFFYSLGLLICFLITIQALLPILSFTHLWSILLLVCTGFAFINALVIRFLAPWLQQIRDGKLKKTLRDTATATTTSTLFTSTELSSTLSQLAHDIRSPLAALELFTKTSSTMDEEEKALAQMSIVRLKNIVAQMRTWGSGSPIVSPPEDLIFDSSKVSPLNFRMNLFQLNLSDVTHIIVLDRPRESKLSTHTIKPAPFVKASQPVPQEISHTLWRVLLGDQEPKKSLALEFIATQKISELKEIQGRLPQNARPRFFVPYELEDSDTNGIEIIGDLGILHQSILVTNQLENPQIPVLCEKIGIPLLYDPWLSALSVTGQTYCQDGNPGLAGLRTAPLPIFDRGKPQIMLKITP